MRNEQRESRLSAYGERKPAEGTESDKRKHPRFEVQYQLKYKQIESKNFRIGKEYAMTFDICSRGVSILVEEKVNISSILIIELIIPGGGSPQSAVGFGKVRWCQKSGEKYRVGLELMWVSFGTSGIDEVSIDDEFVSKLKHELESGTLHVVKDIGTQEIKSFLKLP
ncbi:MAG TPA: hypothetical protein ACFYD6_06955 [Candidatus Brocadiia bacterium]|nr:hypothetical protein [Planctomycetota bacterium]MBI4007542.1 hypothetical protein [Planctomycetota bacterium]MDO8093122.1 hypothetical protein [Candidatus Brocadiales bacterium]